MIGSSLRAQVAIGRYHMKTPFSGALAGHFTGGKQATVSRLVLHL